MTYSKKSFKCCLTHKLTKRKAYWLVFTFFIVVFFIGSLIIYVRYDDDYLSSIKQNAMFQYFVDQRLFRKPNQTATNEDLIWRNTPVVNSTIKHILLPKISWASGIPEGRDLFIKHRCRVSNCVLTVNSSYLPLSEFDAFVIHPPSQRTPAWS